MTPNTPLWSAIPTTNAHDAIFGDVPQVNAIETVLRIELVRDIERRGNGLIEGRQLFVDAQTIRVSTDSGTPPKELVRKPVLTELHGSHKEFMRSRNSDRAASTEEPRSCSIKGRRGVGRDRTIDDAREGDQLGGLLAGGRIEKGTRQNGRTVGGRGKIRRLVRQAEVVPFEAPRSICVEPCTQSNTSARSQILIEIFVAEQNRRERAPQCAGSASAKVGCLRAGGDQRGNRHATCFP